MTDARWDGGIIGQGGPSNDNFVSLWTQLATYYKSESKILFGVMNEPHDCNFKTRNNLLLTDTCQ